MIVKMNKIDKDKVIPSQKYPKPKMIPIIAAIHNVDAVVKPLI
jgi:hypothetical protein